MTIHRVAAVGAASVLSCVVAATAAQAQVRTTGATTTLALPSQTSQLGAQIDFANAKPMRMPAANVAAPSPAKAMASALDPLEIFGRPGAEDGGSGTGEQNPVRLAARQDIPQGSGIEPEEFGTSAQPYTTSRAKAMGDMTTNYYPSEQQESCFF